MMVLGALLVLVVVIFMVWRTNGWPTVTLLQRFSHKVPNATGAQRVTIYTRDEFNSAWHSRLLHGPVLVNTMLSHLMYPLGKIVF